MRIRERRSIRCGVLLWFAAVGGGCATNVNDLLREAHSGDPASVQDAVVEIGEILHEKEVAGLPYTRGDEAGVQYVLEVAQNSDDDLNRARAVAALGRLSRPGFSELFLGSLDDRFWAVRLEAGKALKRRATPADAAPLAAQLDRELRPEVRVELIRALAKSGGDDALEALLRVVFDRSAKYSHNKLVAYDAVCDLSQQTFDLEDKRSWENFYKERFGARDGNEGVQAERSPQRGGGTAPEDPRPPS